MRSSTLLRSGPGWRPGHWQLTRHKTRQLRSAQISSAPTWRSKGSSLLRPVTDKLQKDRQPYTCCLSLFNNAVMGLLQNISRSLRSNQVVEPPDVEKLEDTRQTAQVPQLAYKSRPSPLSLSPNTFKSSIRHTTTLRGLPTHQQSSTYRFLPIISGILIPFSILLSIPSLTDRWYIRTDANNVTIESRPNSLLLNLGMGFSMACSVFANICIILRFAERRVLRMTLLCIFFLTLHGESQYMTISIVIDVQDRPYKYICRHYIWRSKPFQ